MRNDLPKTMLKYSRGGLAGLYSAHHMCLPFRSHLSLTQLKGIFICLMLLKVNIKNTFSSHPSKSF